MLHAWILKTHSETVAAGVDAAIRAVRAGVHEVTEHGLTTSDGRATNSEATAVAVAGVSVRDLCA
jgi:hypothetical protein